MILLAVLLTTAGGVAHYLTTPKEYVATTQIQIERRSLGIAGDQMPWLENWWNMEYYPTQYELLKSRGLAEEVVQELDLVNDPAFNAGGTPPVVEGTDDDYADQAVLGRLADRLRASLSVSPVRSTQLVRLSYRYKDPVFAARAANAFARVFIDRGVSRRQETVGRAQRFLDQQIAELEAEIESLEKEGSVARREADLVGTASGEGSVSNQRLAGVNSDYLDARRKRFSTQSRYEEAVASSPEVTANRYAREVIEPLRRAQQELEQEYEEKSRTFKTDWPPLIELGQRVERGRRELQDAFAREASSAVQTLYSDYQAARREEGRLRQELEAVKDEVYEQSSAASQMGNLEMQIATRRELLNEMLKRQSEAEVAARQQASDFESEGSGSNTNVTVVDRALVPGSPAYPSLRRSLTFGLIAGLLLGIGFVILLELLDRTVKTADEAEKLLDLPVLAVVPAVADDSKGGEAYGYSRRSSSSGSGRSGPRSLVQRRGDRERMEIERLPHLRPRLGVSESYRSLRTALMLSTADELRTVAVTSATTGEGKTATATNLGIVLAQLKGRRVLLMDCDLRRPRLHRVFKLSNRQGLVSALAGGHESELPINSTDIGGLYVATSGPLPPNPSELLASKRMAELVGLLREKFDFVVLDTPPVLPVTDALLVGSHVDGVALCLRAGRVNRDEVLDCRDRLQRADIKILGTVLNGYVSAHGGYGKRYRYYETYAEETEAGSAA